MPSIKKVAEIAGVSVGTVSHVITGSVPVSEPLRLKVQAAIRDLNYHPNHVARSLKTNKTQTLGIIVPDMTISFFPAADSRRGDRRAPARLLADRRQFRRRWRAPEGTALALAHRSAWREFCW